MQFQNIDPTAPNYKADASAVTVSADKRMTEWFKLELRKRRLASETAVKGNGLLKDWTHG